MMFYKRIALILCILLVSAACSVISKQTRKEAAVALPFEVLSKEVNDYQDATVILGGYILETQNLPEKTEITVLQSPLQFRDEPGPKDRSEGRFIIVHKGFLDPEIYRKDRKITVAGRLMRSTVKQVDQRRYAYITMESREIYLWPVYEKNQCWPYDYDPFYPYPYHWYPHRHRHSYYW